jgi:ZIP family zinc transporter
MAILIAFLTVIATALGGTLALRSRDKMHLVLGLSGGLLLGLAAFDLIPSVIKLNPNTLGNVPSVMVFLVIGFLALHILEDLSGAHEPAESDYEHDHEHAHSLTAGLIGASAMVVHVFLDGVAIGLSFQVSNALGVAVAIAVVGHAFTDGLNTVALLINSGNWKKTSAYLLGIDGLARVSGAAVGSYVVISNIFLGSYLALFAGMLIYLSTSHILPEAHSTHPSRLTLLSTVAGVVLMFVIVNFA